MKGKGRRGEEGRGRESGREGAECEDLLPTAAGLVTYLSHGEEVAQEDSKAEARINLLKLCISTLS